MYFSTGEVVKEITVSRQSFRYKSNFYLMPLIEFNMNLIMEFYSE